MTTNYRIITKITEITECLFDMKTADSESEWIDFCGKLDGMLIEVNEMIMELPVESPHRILANSVCELAFEMRD